jgi:hypothetical protein
MASEHGFIPLYSDLSKHVIDKCLESRVQVPGFADIVKDYLKVFGDALL